MAGLAALALVVLSFGAQGSAQAQSATPTPGVADLPTAINLRVHDQAGPFEATEFAGFPGVELRVRFSLLNADTRVALARGDSFPGQLTLLVDGDPYQSTPLPVSGGLAAFVVLDNSGRLFPFGPARDVFAQIQLRATQVVESLGEGASVGLYSTVEQAPRLADVGSTRETINRTIEDLEPINRGRACVNRAVANAVQALRDRTEDRKIVFVLTASGDECADPVASTVIQSAVADDVQVFIIGVRDQGLIDTDLIPLANNTGGTYESSTTINNGLDQPMARLLSQINNMWQASFIVYPSQGTTTADLRVQLSNTAFTQQTLTFAAIPRDYSPPPELQILPGESQTFTTIRFPLQITNPEAVTGVTGQFFEAESQRLVVSREFTDDLGSVAMPATDLEIGVAYVFVATPFNNAGVSFAPVQSQFEFDPPRPSMTMALVSTPSPARDEYVFEARLSNVYDQASHLLVEVVQEQQAGVTSISSFSVPISVTGVLAELPSYTQTLTVPVTGLTDNQAYQVTITAGRDPSTPFAYLDGDEARAVSITTTFVHRDVQPLQRLIYWVTNNPWALALLVMLVCASGVGLLAIIWWIVRRGQQVRVRAIDQALPERVLRPALSSLIERQPSARAEPRRPSPPAGGRAPEAVPQPPAGETVVRKMRMPPLTLTVEMPASLTHEIAVTRTPFVLGRKAGIDGPLPVDATSGVSGEHCKLTYAAGHWMVIDSGSRYGTAVNGQRVVADRPTVLENGALLSLGPKLSLRVRIG